MVRLSEVHASLGAMTGMLSGVPVVLSYGDAPSEYRAMRDSAGIIDRSDLSQIRMWGKDPLRMLNGLITNDLKAAAPDHSVYAAILTPKGRIVSDVRVVTRGIETAAEFVIDIPSVSVDAVATHLTKYVPPLFARWEPAGLGVVGVYGPRSAEVIETAVGARANQEEDSVVTAQFAGSDTTIVATRYAGPGFDLFAPEASLAGLWEALQRSAGEIGGGPVGFEAFEVLRVEAGRPRFGIDVTEESMPAEVFVTSGMMDRAISFTKGCYTGQEVVVRIAHRGHVNRQLRGLLLGHQEAPAFRTRLFESGGRDVGWTTTAVESPMMGQVVALAIIRREIEGGAELRLGDPEGPPAVVCPLPFTRAERQTKITGP
jgi:tRNA-modifying protein YgfZ